MRADWSILVSQLPAPPTKGFPRVASSSPAASPTQSSVPDPRSNGTYPSVNSLIGHPVQNAGFGATRRSTNARSKLSANDFPLSTKADAFDKLMLLELAVFAGDHSIHHVHTIITLIFHRLPGWSSSTIEADETIETHIPYLRLTTFSNSRHA